MSGGGLNGKEFIFTAFSPGAGIAHIFAAGRYGLDI